MRTRILWVSTFMFCAFGHFASVQDVQNGEQIADRTRGQLVEHFNQQMQEGWEFLGGAHVTTRDGESVLLLSGLGHGVWHAARVSDFRLSFRYFHSQGTGNVIFRSSESWPRPQEYHLLLQHDMIQVLRFADGQEHLLTSVPYRLSPELWYDIIIEMQAGRIRILVNGNSILTANDLEPLPEGHLAFGCLMGEGFMYDEIRVSPIIGDVAPQPADIPPAPTDQVAIDVPEWTELDFRRDWELEPGWKIEATPCFDQILHGQGHQWARYVGPVWQDYRMVVQLMLIRGAIHLNFRVSDAQRYFVGVRPDGLYLSKQINEATIFENLAVAERSIPPDEMLLIEISGNDGHLQVFINSDLVIEYVDEVPIEQGGIAFDVLEGEVFVYSAVVAQPSQMIADTLPPRTMAIDPALSNLDIFIPTGPVETPPAQLGRIPMIPSGRLQRRFVWEYMGGPLGGLGYDVRMHPKNKNIMYVSDAWAGVFKSTNYGKTWFPINKGISVKRGLTNDALPVFCCTIDPHCPDTVWVGMKDQRGIFKSTNGGLSWTKMDTGVLENKGITFRGFTIDPRTSDIVYAAAEISSYEWDPTNKKHVGKNFDMTMGVLYKTTDGGKKWKAILYDDNLMRYIWIHPTQPDILYVSTGIFDREAKNTSKKNNYPGGVGVLKSTDGGKTWKRINNGLCNLYIGSLYMHPQNPDILIAGAGCNAWRKYSGVYLTINGGSSWIQTLSVEPEVITSVEFAESDPKIAYAGSAHSIYLSTDMGYSWKKMTKQNTLWGPPGVRSGWPIDFQVDPDDPGTLFANAYGGGNFVSSDSGANWTDASKGYTGALMRDLAVDPNDGNRLFASGRSGIFISTNAGEDWKALNYPPAVGLDNPIVAIDPSNSNHVLSASIWSPAPLLTSDKLGSWKFASTLGKNMVAWKSVAYAPSNDSIVYAGTGGVASFGQFDILMAGWGVYKSTDGGLNWLKANDINSSTATVHNLAVHPEKPAVAYAATTHHGLLKTTDGGKSWHNTSRAAALSVAIHPDHPDTVFVGNLFTGLSRSTNGGSTWIPWMSGMDANARISNIILDPTNPDVMYASDQLTGVYRTENGGQYWVLINDGLFNREVNTMAISSDGKIVYAGTEGFGVFRLYAH